MTFWRLFVFISCWIWFTLVSAESFSFPPLRNLQAFNTLVLGNVPLFQTETILTAPEIILHPNANEINKMCVHCIRNCVEITKVRAHLRLSTGDSRPRCSGPPAAMAGCRGGGVRRFLSVPCPDGLGLSLALPCRSLHAGASQGLPLVSPPPLSSPLSAITTDPMASTPSHLRLQPGPLSDSPHLSSQLPTCCLPRDLGLGISQGGFLPRFSLRQEVAPTQPGNRGAVLGLSASLISPYWLVSPTAPSSVLFHVTCLPRLPSSLTWAIPVLFLQSILYHRSEWYFFFLKKYKSCHLFYKNLQ